MDQNTSSIETSKGEHLGAEAHEVIPKVQVSVTPKLTSVHVYDTKSQKALKTAKFHYTSLWQPGSLQETTY